MAGNVWYDPSSAYGGSQNWLDTPFVKDFVDPQVPQGVYFGYLTQHGLGGGFDRLSQFAQSLYGRSQTGYQAAERNQPGLTYRDYLDQFVGGNAIPNLWASLTPEQRGERPAAFAGRSRFIGRG